MSTHYIPSREMNSILMHIKHFYHCSKHLKAVS